MKVHYHKDVDPGANVPVLLKTLFLCGKFLSAELHNQVASVHVYGFSECPVGTGDPEKYLNYEVDFRGHFLSQNNRQLYLELRISARVDRKTMSSINRISILHLVEEGGARYYSDGADSGLIEESRRAEYLNQFGA